MSRQVVSGIKWKTFTAELNGLHLKFDLTRYDCNPAIRLGIELCFILG